MKRLQASRRPVDADDDLPLQTFRPPRRALVPARSSRAAEASVSAAPPISCSENVLDVILRDGSTLRLHPPASGDAQRLLAPFRGLSPESLHLRCHGMPGLTPGLVENVLEPDWAERGALIGTLAGDGGKARPIAVEGLVRDRGEAERLGHNARRRAIDEFLGDRHLRQYADVLGALGRSEASTWQP
jgi:hypothetical protein